MSKNVVILIVSYDTITTGGDYCVPSVVDIQQVLSDLRTAIDAGKFQPIPRQKNKNTLARLGLTWQDAKDEIYELEPRHYYQGPSTDRDRPTSDKFWVFKKCVEGEVLYIKFKVLYQEDGGVKLVSFHIDEA